MHMQAIKVQYYNQLMKINVQNVHGCVYIHACSSFFQSSAIGGGGGGLQGGVFLPQVDQTEEVLRAWPP